MTKTILRWGLIALLISISPLIYTEIQGYITTNAVFPVINSFSAKPRTALILIFTIFNIVSAILTSIVTALPCGYLAGKQSKVIAIVFIVSILWIPVSVVFQGPKVSTFIAVVFLGQLVAVVFSAFIFAEMGSRLAEKRQDNV